MEDILKKEFQRTLIFDSTEDNFYSEHSLKLNNGDPIQFVPTELSRFNSANQILGDKITKSILNFTPGIERYEPMPGHIGYKNEEGLPVYFKKIDNYIAVISLGEFQPGRYKIYVECVFSKSN